MKQIIHKAAFIGQWIFVGTNFATAGTDYWIVSILLWITSFIIYVLTLD